MQSVLEAGKLVKYGGDICGKTEKDFEVNRKKKKEWNTTARRAKMFKRIQERPERLISNYAVMLTNLGAIDTESKIKHGIAKLFGNPSMSCVTLFTKECTRRRSLEEGMFYLLKSFFLIIILDESELEEQPCEMDITFSDLNSVTRSMDDSYQLENNELKEKIKKLELEVKDLQEREKRVEPLVKLYERVKEVKNGSGQMIINPNLTRLNIILER